MDGGSLAAVTLMSPLMNAVTRVSSVGTLTVRVHRDATGGAGCTMAALH